MSGPDWDSAQTLFLQYLRYERNLSEETVRAYASDLSQFASYARGLVGTGVLEPGAITPETVRGFMVSVYRSLEKASRARKLSALRSFFRYLCGAGFLVENPAELVEIHCKISALFIVIFHQDERRTAACLSEGASNTISGEKTEVVLG
jgi:site-specific recombinase XerD